MSYGAQSARRLVEAERRWLVWARLRRLTSLDALELDCAEKAIRNQDAGRPWRHDMTTGEIAHALSAARKYAAEIEAEVSAIRLLTWIDADKEPPP